MLCLTHKHPRVRPIAAKKLHFAYFPPLTLTDDNSLVLLWANVQVFQRRQHTINEKLFSTEEEKCSATPCTCTNTRFPVTVDSCGSHTWTTPHERRGYMYHCLINTFVLSLGGSQQCSSYCSLYAFNIHSFFNTVTHNSSKTNFKKFDCLWNSWMVTWVTKCHQNHQNP